MKILLIGPQGSGKSTQAELLAKNLNVPKISTGDIFRKLSEEDSPEGYKIREIQKSGNLVDDETTAKIVKERLEEKDAKNGFVLDGYPRNISQNHLFDPQFDKVIYLKVPDEELLRRLTERGRSDDTPLSIRKRLDLYYGQTEPLLSCYRNTGILTEIDGTLSIEEVANEIKKSV